MSRGAVGPKRSLLVLLPESFYEVPRARVAELARAVIAFPPIVVLDPTMLLRALEVYETDQLDLAEGRPGRAGGAVGRRGDRLLDRAIDRVPTVRRLEPA